MWLAEQRRPETLPSATCFVQHRALNSRKGLTICQLLLTQDRIGKAGGRKSPCLFLLYLRLVTPFNFLHRVVLLIPSALQTTSRSPLQEASAARISSASMWRLRSRSVSASSRSPEGSPESALERTSKSSGAIACKSSLVSALAPAPSASASSTAIRSITFCNSRTLPGHA